MDDASHDSVSADVDSLAIAEAANNNGMATLKADSAGPI